MQVIWPVVDGQGIFDAVKCEFTPGDTVGETANYATKIRDVGKILLKIVKAEHHIVKPAVFVRHFQRDDDTAVVRNFCTEAGLIRQGKQTDLLTVRCFAKIF